VTVICPLANSYILDAAREAGSIAELASSHKEQKYARLDSQYMFVPIAFENLGVTSESTHHLLAKLGRRLTEFFRQSRDG